MTPRNIRERIRFSVITAAAMTVLVFLVLAGIEQINRVQEAMDKKIHYLAHLGQQSLAMPVWNLDDKSMDEIIDAIFADEDVVYIAVVEKAGVMTRRIDPAYRHKPLAWFDVRKRFSTIDVPVQYDGHDLAHLQLVLSNKSLRSSIYRDFGYVFILTVLLITIITARTIAIIRSRIFSPLKEFEDAVTAIANGDMQVSIPYADKEDEIGRLGKAFESMRQSIQSLIQQLNDTNAGLEDKVRERTQDLENAHRNIRSSIEYASMIQSALIPREESFRDFFRDYFIIWEPKDVVGGDIFLFDTLRKNHDECLLMVIDCTGHGVAGAFVTMLVKAVERQIIEQLVSNDEEVSPADILICFNRVIKQLLQQQDGQSISNVGFDGSVLYINREKSCVRFAGARGSLIYTDGNELKQLRGSRHSVGYRDSDTDFVFDEYHLDVQPGTRFYLATDGYTDQLGGEHGFCLGTKRLIRSLMAGRLLPMSKQKTQLLDDLKTYQGAYERNDDVTVIGVEI